MATEDSGLATMSNDGFWVFGYGSLIWRPEFKFETRELATLRGFHRSFCMRSIHYRGTADDPGLVLALDPKPEASCRGVAFRVGPAHAEETLLALRERELISSAYLETWQEMELDHGGRATAVCYVVDTGHAQYCGGLSLEEQANVIAKAEGLKGPNDEYLFNTVDSLERLGIADADLRRLSELVQARNG
ncbi:MAG: gamma-glutamylcyclotransferase [Paracoccaceae bacterium]